MAVNIRGRSFLKLLDYTPAEIRYLLDLSKNFKDMKRAGVPLPVSAEYVHGLFGVCGKVQIADRVNIHANSIADFSRKGKIFMPFHLKDKFLYNEPESD